jgi:molecular chaperone Hsp33
MILQIQGDGALKTLVAQANNQREIRGLVRTKRSISEGTLQQMTGQGRLVLTTQSDQGEPYQGIVALEGTRLSEVLENYFQQSEQLPTRLWLVADETRVAGLFLQKLPSDINNKDDWTRVTALAETVTQKELLSLDSETLLYRLFHEETLKLFQKEPVCFKCQCSSEKISETLRALGRKELKATSEQQQTLEVGCEFCGQQYSFDENAIEALYEGM